MFNPYRLVQQILVRILSAVARKSSCIRACNATALSLAGLTTAAKSLEMLSGVQILFSFSLRGFTEYAQRDQAVKKIICA